MPQIIVIRATLDKTIIVIPHSIYLWTLFRNGYTTCCSLPYLARDYYKKFNHILQNGVVPRRQIYEKYQCFQLAFKFSCPNIWRYRENRLVRVARRQLSWDQYYRWQIFQVISKSHLIRLYWYVLVKCFWVLSSFQNCNYDCFCK